MNPVALFIGGILLGVLLALSLISRYPSGSPPVEVKSVSQPTVEISSPIVKANSPTVLKPVPALSLFGNVGSKPAEDAVVEAPKIPNVVPNVPIERKPIEVKDNSAVEVTKPDVAVKARWAPGKEGEFSKIKASSAGSSGSTSTTPSETSIVSDPPKKLRPGKLRREYMRAQRQNGGVSTAVVETEVSVTSVPMNVSVPRVTDVPNPFLPYHSQASTDFNTYKAYIPTLELATARVR